MATAATATPGAALAELADAGAAFTDDTLLVAPAWLVAQPPGSVTILDASWYMPAARRDTRSEHASRRIPGAAFFDIDGVVDRSNPLPHMLPPAREWAAAAAALGVRHGRPVVVYDSAGLLSAARAWWTLRVFGHPRAALLHGGLPRWVAEGRPLESGPPLTAPAPHEEWVLNSALVRSLEQVAARPADELVVDARPAARFEGREPEPRPGVASGHIPRSRSLPFTALLSGDAAHRTFLPPAQLRAAFEAAGVSSDGAGMVVTSCGSGVTAAVLVLALRLLGRPESAVALYDGAWSEWGARGDMEKELGPAAAAALGAGGASAR